MANFPNRCQHLKINGTQCGSPALRRNRFCFFHKRFQDERIKLGADRARRRAATFVLPVLEDANSIQVALMQVMRLLVAQQIEHKTASLLLYALQTASTNLRLTNFKPFVHDVILDPRDAANTPLDSHIWDDDDFEEELDEEEELADEAVAALESARKKKEKDAAMMRWAEAEADRLQAQGSRERAELKAQVAAQEAAQAAAEANASSSTPPPTPDAAKKPSTSTTVESGSNVDKIRADIRDQIRKSLFPGLPASKSPGK